MNIIKLESVSKLYDATTPFYPVEERETYLKSIICLTQTLE